MRVGAQVAYVVVQAQGDAQVEKVILIDVVVARGPPG
jgi:hypothetical protein